MSHAATLSPRTLTSLDIGVHSPRNWNFLRISKWISQTEQSGRRKEGNYWFRRTQFGSYMERKTREEQMLEYEEGRVRVPSRSACNPYLRKLIAKEECYGKHIHIYSDNYAVFTTLKRINTCSKLVGDCERALKKVACHNKLTILWVSSYHGVRSNTEVEKYASGGGHKSPEPSGTSGELVKKLTNRWSHSESARH